MGYTREDSEKLDGLGLEFLSIMQETGKGKEVDDRTPEQVNLVNEVVERMQPGIWTIAINVLNGKSLSFLPGIRFHFDINSFNKTQLEEGDLVNVGSVFVVERFGCYDPLKAGVPSFVLYYAKRGMYAFAIKNIPKGYKVLRRGGYQRKEIPLHLSFDEINDSIGDGESGNGYFNCLERRHLSQPPDQYEKVALAEETERIRNCLKKLPPRMERIIRQHFGLNGKQLTLEEIGLKFGTTRQAVEQTENRAFKKLREILMSEYQKDHGD